MVRQQALTCIKNCRRNMKELITPDTFPFPFEPYNIQKDFMSKMYEVIENKKIGIFESPTGTGKSMSIICASLKWLADNDNRIRQPALQSKKDTESKGSNNDGFDWIEKYSVTRLQNQQNTEQRAIEKFLTERDKKLKKIRVRQKQSSFPEPQSKRVKYAHADKDDALRQLMDYSKKLIQEDSSELDKDYEQFLLDDYCSDDETSSKNTFKSAPDEIKIQKIYYCSRTHSQLSQFIHELQKSPYAEYLDSFSKDKFIYTTLVTLASRQSLCINDQVRNLGSVHAMNESCLDMQKNSKPTKFDEIIVEQQKKKSKKASGCPYYKNKSAVEDLSDYILYKVQDIEDVVKKGKEMKACPYYAERGAVSMAQIVVVPYQILLHDKTRQASGIDLTDQIVIVDEAHNLVDTITNIHSIQIQYGQVLKAENQLTQYMGKFSKRLKAKNLHYIRQILFVLKGFLQAMESKETMQAEKDRPTKPVNHESLCSVVKVNEFLFQCKIEHINLFKVLQYCERSMISKKLNGFIETCHNLAGTVAIEHKNEKQQQSDQACTMRSPLQHIEGFFRCLTSSDGDGRITLNKCTSANSRDGHVKYNLLNPATHFKEVVSKCRSLIVAGGTMQPTSCFIDQLLLPTGINQSRIEQFSCGHVINQEQLLPMVLNSGPGGTPFEFTFQNRTNFKMIRELGQLLCNISCIIPGGIVCFFPSYSFESCAYEMWAKQNVISKISQRKKVFREPKKSQDVDRILSEYKKCIQKSSNINLTGSILFSVVGGKMSEGINFSDDLGRCVVMIGMPYPNLRSPELKEKINYLNENMPDGGSGKTAGTIYYENLCMKAVNQSIGRAIRHKNDFSTIILADKRYGNQNIVDQLPGWIKDKLHKFDRFGACFAAIRKFFNAKKEN